MQAASTQSLKRALINGGFTIISQLAIVEEHRAGTLVGLPVRGVNLSRDLVAKRLPRRSQTGGTRAFWRWLAQANADSSLGGQHDRVGTVGLGRLRDDPRS